MRKFFTVSLLLIAVACANTNCREIREKSGVPAPVVAKDADPMTKTATADRVRVFKSDGSLQCQQGDAVPLSEMQKELAGLHVLAAMNTSDGLLRTQVCGSPTGKANVYTIPREELGAALKLGFKEWTND